MAVERVSAFWLKVKSYVVTRITKLFLFNRCWCLKMPEIIVDYDMSSHKFSIVHQEEVLGISSNYISCSPANDVTTENEMPKIWKDFSSKYNCERKEVISDDGIAIPLTVLYSRKAWKRDQSPGLLIGYGAYDVNLDKSWCSDRLSLLDRGWIIAFADVRSDLFFYICFFFLVPLKYYFLVLFCTFKRTL